MVGLFYYLTNRFTRYILLPIYTRISVDGLENVPRRGPLIIVCNHLNDADPGIIASRMPRRIAFMAKSEFFRMPGMSLFMKAYGAFPVRRGEADLAALRRANETLKQGLALGMFPEGRTSTSKAELAEAWPGAALVALRNDTPIVPVAITGSQRLMLPYLFLRPFRRERVQIKIGLPFQLPRPQRVNAEAAQAGTRLIMEKIAALLPEQYRGYYRKEPGSGEAAPLPESGE